MSWFTAHTNATQPSCERCKTPEAVVLVKRGPVYNIFDCKRCGVIEPKRGKQ